MQKTASEELSIQDLSENLAAAGCDEALIREWIQLHQNHELPAQLQLLQRHHSDSTAFVFSSRSCTACSSAGAMWGIAATRPPPALAWPFSNRWVSW